MVLFWRYIHKNLIKLKFTSHTHVFLRITFFLYFNNSQTNESQQECSSQSFAKEINGHIVSTTFSPYLHVSHIPPSNLLLYPTSAQTIPCLFLSQNVTESKKA